jgi:hypothetical protein
MAEGPRGRRILFSKATFTRWVLAVPEASPIKSAKDLQGKRIATEVVNLTRKYLRKHKVKAEVEFSGCHRGEGARTGGRDRGSHRDRFIASRTSCASSMNCSSLRHA